MSEDTAVARWHRRQARKKAAKQRWRAVLFILWYLSSAAVGLGLGAMIFRWATAR